MKRFLSVILVISMFFGLMVTVQAEPKKKIAFAGDSITYGAGLSNRTEECFVSILARENPEYEMGNFGSDASSALSSAVKPYINTKEYRDSIAFAPDILFIMLGTNDIKNENWDEGKDKYVDDYVALINSYKDVNPSLEVYVGIPPRIFKENVYGERSPEILEKQGIPKMFEVVRRTGATAVNLFNMTKNSAENFPDFLHPDKEIHELFATIIAGTMINGRSKRVANSASEWAQKEIFNAYAADIIPSSLMGEYKRDITRKEFCQVVVNILPDNLTKTRTAAFKDCSDASVNYAYSVGVVSGMSETEFAPDAKATREEMAAMIYRAFKLLCPTARRTASGNYPDGDKISAWAAESVDFLNQNKIMSGDEKGNINPKNNTTVEQAILLVFRAFCASTVYKA